MLLVDFLDALGFLVQLSFGSSHLTLLRQQLVLQLQQFGLTLLDQCQQLLFILMEKGRRPKKFVIAERSNFTSATVCQEMALNTDIFLNLIWKKLTFQEKVGNKYLPSSLVTKQAILDEVYTYYRKKV